MGARKNFQSSIGFVRKYWIIGLGVEFSLKKGEIRSKDLLAFEIFSNYPNSTNQ